MGHSEDGAPGYTACCCSHELRRKNVFLVLVLSCWSLRKSEKMEITCHSSSLRATSTYPVEIGSRGAVSFLLRSLQWLLLAWC